MLESSGKKGHTIGKCYTRFWGYGIFKRWMRSSEEWCAKGIGGSGMVVKTTLDFGQFL